MAISTISHGSAIGIALLRSPAGRSRSEHDDEDDVHDEADATRNRSAAVVSRFSAERHTQSRNPARAEQKADAKQHPANAADTSFFARGSSGWAGHAHGHHAWWWRCASSSQGVPGRGNATIARLRLRRHAVAVAWRHRALVRVRHLARWVAGRVACRRWVWCWGRGRWVLGCRGAAGLRLVCVWCNVAGNRRSSRLLLCKRRHAGVRCITSWRWLL